MAEREVVSVEKGIWIDHRRLAEAGLDGQLEISVLPGEIRICRAAPVKPQATAGWGVFASLGRDAKPGRLADPSVRHDNYLYGPVQ